MALSPTLSARLQREKHGKQQHNFHSLLFKKQNKSQSDGGIDTSAGHHRASTGHLYSVFCFFFVSDGLARLPSDLVEGRRGRNTLSADRVVFSADDDDDDDVVALLNTRLYLSCGDLASSDGPQHEREGGKGRPKLNILYYRVVERRRALGGKFEPRSGNQLLPSSLSNIHLSLLLERCVSDQVVSGRMMTSIPRSTRDSYKHGIFKN